MAIVIIQGSAQAAREYADTVRNAHIAKGKGALIVNQPGIDHPVQHQIEKILAGVPLPERPDVAALPWKPGSVVLVPAALEPALKEFEKRCPGFTKFFGPVKRVSAPE